MPRNHPRNPANVSNTSDLSMADGGLGWGSSVVIFDGFRHGIQNCDSIDNELIRLRKV